MIVLSLGNKISQSSTPIFPRTLCAEFWSNLQATFDSRKSIKLPSVTIQIPDDYYIVNVEPILKIGEVINYDLEKWSVVYKPQQNNVWIFLSSIAPSRPHLPSGLIRIGHVTTFARRINNNTTFEFKVSCDGTLIFKDVKIGIKVFFRENKESKPKLFIFR